MKQKMKKVGKYNVYLEETSSKDAPNKVEWHVTAHNPLTMANEDLGHHTSEEAALDAAKKFCLG